MIQSQKVGIDDLVWKVGFDDPMIKTVYCRWSNHRSKVLAALTVLLIVDEIISRSWLCWIKFQKVDFDVAIFTLETGNGFADNFPNL